MKIGNLKVGLTDNLRNTFGLSIAEHRIKTVLRKSVDLISILNKSHSSFYLSVLKY